MTKAVLLDLYGTLVEPDWPRLTCGRDAIADRVGVPAKAAHTAWAATHARRMRGEHGSLEGDLAAVFAAAGGRASERIGGLLLAELAELERANWRDGVRLYPDALPALERLRRGGVRLAIVTNASAEAACVVPRLGLDRLVELVLASCEARAMKPKLLDVALRQLGVEPCEGTLVDDEPQQVAAARRIGMNAVLVRRDAPDAKPAGDVTREVVRDLTELADLVLAVASGPRR